MFQKSLIAGLFAVLCGGALWGQVDPNDPIAYPTKPLPYRVLSFDIGGAKFKPNVPGVPRESIPPHRIIANVYYVGANGWSLYLITSDQGHILIDAGFERSWPQIQKNIADVGFRYQDIKILLVTHGHADHSEAAAIIKKTTGCQLMVMHGDVETVETGGVPEAGGSMPPAHVDRILHDKDVISLGGNVITAYDTPGHSPGATTYMWKVQDGGKTYTVLSVASLSINDAKYFVSPSAPDLAEQYLRTYRTLKSLPCDVFLEAHDSFFDLPTRYHKLKEGGPNPYIDPAGCREFIAENEDVFYYKLDWANRWSTR